MPFNRPTLQQLIDRSVTDIEAALPGTDAKLRRTNLNVLAKAMAGTSHGMHAYIAWLAKQVLPDTADEEYLERHASLWLDEPRKAAAPATGNVTFTGTNGVVIPLGTSLVRADVAEFVTTAEGTIVGGVATVAVEAVDAGAAGNCAAGTAMTLTTPIPGVTSAAAVDAGGLTGGADIESLDALRARVLARIKEPPHGGAAADYETWALEVAGVTRAWVYPQELGPGTVTVRFVRDNDASLIPDAAEVAAVQAYIDALRPVTAKVTVVAPIAVPLDFTIALTPSTAAVKAAVQAELEDLILREAVPGGTILISHIREAISIATGETDHVLTVPAADVTHTTGQMATMGAITWA
ncbi:MAG: baseplate J/gp47 family protein [Pseudomonadota bacterium]